MPASLPALVMPLAALLAPLTIQAPAQPPSQPPAPSQVALPKLVVGAPGSCEMTVGGQPRPCSSGLVYVQHANGSILLSVQAGPGVTIGLEADSDSQPRPEDYRLNLVRLHTSVDGRSAAKQVTGSCEISLSADGQLWHRVTCRATDRSGLVTLVSFTGSGRPVVAERPGGGAATPPAGRKAPATPRG